MTDTEVSIKKSKHEYLRILFIILLGILVICFVSSIALVMSGFVIINETYSDLNNCTEQYNEFKTSIFINQSFQSGFEQGYYRGYNTAVNQTIEYLIQRGLLK